MIRLENVRANLAAPGDIAFFAILPINLGALFVLLDFVKFRFQHFERELAVAPLTALRLAGDDDAGRLVRDAHGGFDFVDVLPSFSAATKGVDLQIDRVNFDRRGIGDLRDNIDTGKGSVTAFVRIERRDAHQPMHAALGLKMTVGVFATY